MPRTVAQMTESRYCLITPCRDEATFARRTLESVARQSVPPALWVIVDDGSTDQTPNILNEYAGRLPYIRIVRRENRGFRKLGGGVMDAFYAGFETIDPRQFDYICKLDLDLDLPPTYFETLIARMNAQPRLGTCSGKPYFRERSLMRREVCGDENSVGMAKFYRVRCFDEIGGFVRELMWDGIDGHQCRMLGWIAASWDDPDLNFEHLRPMGTSHKSWWTGRVRHGAGQWFMGTLPLYLLASAAFRLLHPPVLIGSLAITWGYLKGWLTGKKRYDAPGFRKYLRTYQWLCLVRGKHAATDEMNRRGKLIWDQRAGKLDNVESIVATATDPQSA